MRVLSGPLAFSALLHHAQIIGYREDPGHAVGLNVGYVLVTFVADNAFQSNVTVLYDDVNRGHSLKTISSCQLTAAINRKVHGPPSPIVHRRNRQNLDI